MASTDPYKKYVNIEGVRATYRHQDDTIHITTTDPDLQAGGFHLTLNPGTQTEKSLREIMTEQGVIKNPTDLKPGAYNRPGRSNIFALASAKGGAGKSTLALSIAAALAGTNPDHAPAKKVCLIDLDFRDGQIGFLLGQTSPSALNIYLNPDKTAETIEMNVIPPGKLGMYSLLAPKRARTAEFLTVDFYKEIIGELATMFDYLILDTGVFNKSDEHTAAAYEMSDAILYVTNLGIASIYSMSRWMGEVTSSVDEHGLGIDKGKVGVIVNQAQTDVGVDQELITKAADGAVLIAAVPYEKQVLKRSNYNTMDELLTERTDFTKSIMSIVKKLG